MSDLTPGALEMGAEMAGNAILEKLIREMVSLTCLIITLYDRPGAPACADPAFEPPSWAPQAEARARAEAAAARAVRRMGRVPFRSAAKALRTCYRSRRTASRERLPQDARCVLNPPREASIGTPLPAVRPVPAGPSRRARHWGWVAQLVRAVDS